MHLGWLMLSVVVMYYMVTRLLPQLLSWLLVHRYSLQLSLGKIGLHPLCVYGLRVARGPVKLSADRVTITSSLFNSQVHRPLAVCLYSVLVEQTDRWPDTAGAAGRRSGSAVSQLLSVAQFAGLYLHQLRAVCGGGPARRLHLDADRVTVEGTNTIDNELTLVLRVASLHASLVDVRAQEHPLGRLLTELELQTTVVQEANGIVQVEDVSIRLARPDLMVSDQLLLHLTSDGRPHLGQSHPARPNTSLPAWQGLVPRSASLSFSGLLMTSLHGDSQLTTQLGVCRLEMATVAQPAVGPARRLAEATVSLRLEELSVDSAGARLAGLANLQLSVRAEGLLCPGRSLELAVGGHTLQLTYHHVEVSAWLARHRDTACRTADCTAAPTAAADAAPTAAADAGPTAAATAEETADWAAGGGWKLRLDAELWDVEICLILPDMEPVSACLTHGKLGGCPDGWELVLETLTCCLAGAEASLHRHHLGAALVLGVLLLKHHRTQQGRLKLGLLLDNLQVEGSESAARLLQFVVNTARYLRPPSRPHSTVRSASRSGTVSSQREEPPDLHLQASNVTLVCVTGEHYAAARLGSVTAERTDGQLTGGVELAAVTAGRPAATLPLPCHKSAPLAEPACRLALLRLRGHPAHQLTLAVRDSVQLHWSPTVHRHLKRTADAATGWVRLVWPAAAAAAAPAASAAASPPKLRLRLKAAVTLDALLAARCRLAVTLAEATVTRDEDTVTLSAAAPRVLFDGHPIVALHGLKAERTASSSTTAALRAPIEGLQLRENACWEVSICRLEVSVPYGYDLSAAWSEELLTTVRWLKRLHAPDGGPDTAAGALPADVCVKIQHFSMEICDDPFEVKLRDNYELREDEYHESVKRHATLDVKIEQQRRLHGLLQARKVESLYSQLRQRDAQLFVQRAQKMYEVAPMRSRLLLWSMESLEVTLLTDPSLHGRAACVANLRRLDPLTPWPDDEPQFSRLWCCELVAGCHRWTVALRDYPQSVLDVRRLHVWGRLVGAEQAAGQRSTRHVTVRLQPPFGELPVSRSLHGLKLYYDLSADADRLVAAYGPCWEPAMALLGLCMERVTPPSHDPSPPLTWWDKARLRLHGRLTLSVQQMTLLLHASLDPYNTTEEMELTFADLVVDWPDGKLVCKGDCSVYVRTASKYDDCRLLFVPNVKLSAKMDWLCMGDPRDHHAVVPCARDQLPEYSSNQEHDSYRAYRSHGLDLSLAVETRPAAGAAPPPTVLLYGSTLRWFENLQFILSGVTRPTRRGAVFANVRPRKQQLSRHYRRVRLALNVHAFQVCYWMSFTRQHGVDVRGGRVSLSSEHRLSLRPVADGLRHRPRACWTVEYVNCELNDAEVWLQSSLDGAAGSAAAAPVDKWFFLSVTRISYGRAAVVAAVARDGPTHRLVVHSMKAAWTKDNRDAGFALVDSFASNQQLKRNLSTAALRGINIDAGGGRTPLKRRVSADSLEPAGGGVTSPGGALSASLTNTPSPMSRLQSGQAATMLQKLIAESGSAPVAFSEDAGGERHEQALRGVAACHTADVLHNNWLVELVNCQVLLKGIETRGYVIITSTKSQVLQRAHRPVWRGRTLVSKTSWAGGLEGMQYYATVGAGERDPASENIMWLTVDNIERRADDEVRDVPDLVGSGQSVGGVVTETVGGCAGAEHRGDTQLQRVVSRCRCEFFYVSYGEMSVDPDSVDAIPPLPQSPSDIWADDEQPVDALTVIYHDLNVCTNSLQYAMVLDIVNNLLLYVAPRKRQSYDQLQRMRFQMQLSSIEDQRKPIQQLQNRIRSMMSEIRQLEKATYLLQRQRDEAGSAERLHADMAEHERQTLDKKELLTAFADELAMRIHIYKEMQLSKSSQKPTARKGDGVSTSQQVRTNEVVIGHAQWRLTESDGQLGLADLVISGFQYNKYTKNDDSVEHLLELGYISMSNLLPNQTYRDVLQPAEVRASMPVDRQRCLRVYFRERPPVGGISVKEHLEINVTPIHIGMTYQFFKIMLKFCFPERDTEYLEEDALPKERLSKKERRRHKKESSFYVAIEKDDVEKMKERAQNNMLFIYIKVPEVTVRVSYKGEKEKNLEDVHNFLLTVPTLEYHNVTWTWLDLLLAMKNDTKRVLLSQAIKQKLQIGGRSAGAEEAVRDEEDKARILFGSLLAPGSEKGRPTRKGLFHLHRS